MYCGAPPGPGSAIYAIYMKAGLSRRPPEDRPAGTKGSAAHILARAGQDMCGGF